VLIACQPKAGKTACAFASVMHTRKSRGTSVCQLYVYPEWQSYLYGECVPKVF